MLHNNADNKEKLAEDFFHRCAYCNDMDIYGGGFRAYQVEHFAPKSKFPELEFNYDNLLYACPWCNRAKWNTWPSDDPSQNIVGEIGFIDPCSDEYDKHLKRLPKGNIVGITPLGKYMYKMLQLYLKRHEIIYNLDRVEKEIDKLALSIRDDEKEGKDCSLKKEAYNILQNEFYNYFKEFKVISQQR